MNHHPQGRQRPLASSHRAPTNRQHQNNGSNLPNDPPLQSPKEKGPASSKTATSLGKKNHIPVASRGAFQAHTSDLPNNLRSQTPLNRKLRQQTMPSEPGTSRRATKPQYFRIKTKARKQRLSILGWRIVLVLLCYAVLMPISLFLVSLWLPHHTTPETKDFVYQLGSDKDVVSKKIYSWSTVRADDIYYLDMTGIATYCEMATTGDHSRMRYIVKATGETVEFVLGQSIAYINGIPERIGGNVYIRNERVYVPLDFVARCFTGIQVTLDAENNKITLVRDMDDKENPVTVGFRYKLPIASDAVIFNELSLDLQNQILFQTQSQTPSEDSVGIDN